MKQWWRDFWTAVWIVKGDLALGAAAILALAAMVKWALDGQAH